MRYLGKLERGGGRVCTFTPHKNKGQLVNHHRKRIFLIGKFNPLKSIEQLDPISNSKTKPIFGFIIQHSSYKIRSNRNHILSFQSKF